MNHPAPPHPIGLSVPTATISADLPGVPRMPIRPTFAELVNTASRIRADNAAGFSLIPRLLRAFLTTADPPPPQAGRDRFTLGYPTANKLGGTVLYGALLGFVVYVVTELANQSRYAGVLNTAFAAARPAFAASSIGLTVLYKEDGRAG